MDERQRGQLYELQEKMKMLEARIEGTQDPVWMEAWMKEHDECYALYWEQVYQLVDRSVLEEVERRIGYGHFIDQIFLEMLDEVLKETEIARFDC